MATVAEKVAPMDAQPSGGAEVARMGLAEDGAMTADVAKPREAFWDNVKAVCVLLVVIVHTVETAKEVGELIEGKLAKEPDRVGDLRATDSVGYVAGVLLVVVMPSFSFISGHLSSREIGAPHRVRALLQLALVACIQQVIWFFCLLPLDINNVGIASGDKFHWFIVCLALWRVSLPFWMLLRKPLLVAVVVGVLGVLVDDQLILRVFLGFLPFFIAGHVTPRETLNKFRHAAVQIGFFGVVALAALVPFVLPQEVHETAQRSIDIIGDTYRCFNYNSASCRTWSAIPWRVLYYLLAIPLIPSFLAVVPERRVWGLTHAGRLSMYIYLLHMWFLVPWIFMTKKMDGGVYVASSLVYAFLVWALLGTGCARPFCKFFIEPPIDCVVQKWVLEDWAEKRPACARQPTADSQV